MEKDIMQIGLLARLTIDRYISENHYNRKKFYQKLIPRYKKIVKAMEKDFDLGGKANPMAAPNVSIMAGIFALWDITGRKLTEKELTMLIRRAVPKKIPVLTDLCRSIFPFIVKILHESSTSLSKQVEAHKKKGEWKDSWGMEVKPLDPTGNSISFDLIGCPIIRFAEKYGYDKIVKALCKSDFMTPRLLGARLIRPHTVAEGYDRCCYTYVPDNK